MNKFTNQAVVSWSGHLRDEGSILYMSGKDIEDLFGPGGTYSDDDSVGCVAAVLDSCPGMPKGISVWEGEITDTVDENNPFEATGTYRRPTLFELACVVEGFNPFEIVKSAVQQLQSERK
jgi:hypothetical protein